MPYKIDFVYETGESGYVVAPFDSGKLTLENYLHDIISLEKNAELRMLAEKVGGNFLGKGNFVREAVIYSPEENPIIVAESPVLKHASEATLAHADKKEFFLTDKQIEMARTIGHYIPSSDFSIPTNMPAEKFYYADLFLGNIAEKYLLWLEQRGIKEMKVLLVSRDYVDKQEKPFVRQILFGGLEDSLRGCNSCIICDTRQLHNDIVLRGIKEKDFLYKPVPAKSKELIYAAA